MKAMIISHMRLKHSQSNRVNNECINFPAISVKTKTFSSMRMILNFGTATPTRQSQSFFDLKEENNAKTNVLSHCSHFLDETNWIKNNNSATESVKTSTWKITSNAKRNIIQSRIKLRCFLFLVSTG